MAFWERVKGALRGLMVGLGGGPVVAMQDLDDTGVIEMDEVPEGQEAPDGLMRQNIPKRYE